MSDNGDQHLPDVGDKLCQPGLVAICILGMDKVAAGGFVQQRTYDQKFPGGFLLAAFGLQFPDGITQDTAQAAVAQTGGFGRFDSFGARLMIWQSQSSQLFLSTSATKYNRQIPLVNQ